MTIMLSHGKVYYIGPLISGICMSSAVIATNGQSLTLLMAHRALSWSTISMSNSFIGPVTISDMFTSEELALNTASFFGAAGLGIIVAPPVRLSIPICFAGI